MLFVSVILALIPVGIWLTILRKHNREDRGLLIRTFLWGTFSVVPPFLLILLFEKFPELNIYSIINRSVEEVALAILLTNIVVGIIEEIAKHLIVRIIDKRHPEYIQTISTALALSICAGLGFSFAENIFYFYSISSNPEYGIAVLFSTFIFRSVFTMCGHMVFSGIFGYYFGIGKFAPDIAEETRWEGSRMRFTRFLSKITGRMPFQVFREEKIMTGLFIAMGMHALFNASLDLEHKISSIMIVGAGAFFIAYLLKTKSGHLLFSIAKRRASSMAPADQDVVMELIGMWLHEGKLREVIEICDRLLMRDPDNNVVKLFRAKASDNQKLKQAYAALKSFFEKENQMPGTVQKSPALSPVDEQVVLEVMDQWYREKKYEQVLAVAKRLLAKNPRSEGAKLLFEKSLDREKLRKIFEALGRLFKE